MKNKKILLVPFFALSAASLSSCLLMAKERKQSVDPSTHVHHASEEYKYDAYGHYHICDCGLEEPRYDYEAHDFETKDGYPTCKVCGYVDNAKDVNYKEVQTALNEFLAYEGNLSFVTETKILSYVSDTIITSDVITQKATLDRENGRYYSKSVEDSMDREGTETTSNAYIISTNDNADGEYRYYEIDDSSKTQYLSDEGYASYLFDNLFTNIDDMDISFSQYAKWIVNNDKTDDFLAAFPSLISQVGLSSCDVYEVDGLTAFEIAFGCDDNSYEAIEHMDFKVIFYAKDGLLSGFEVRDIYSYKYPIGAYEVVDYCYKVTFARELDSEVSAECLSQIDGSVDSGLGAEVSVDIYYMDYLWENPINTKIGSQITWEYGDVVALYTDEERTIPYVDQPIGSDTRILYAKVNEKMPDTSSNSAAVVNVEDITIIDTNRATETHRKIFKGITVHDTSTSPSVFLPWTSGEDERCEEISQAIYVNGEPRELPSIDTQYLNIEAGKIYLVINCYSSFTWVQD